MKCFDCGIKCQTVYHYGFDEIKIIAVSQKCPDYLYCGWESYKTKVPGSIKDHN